MNLGEKGKRNSGEDEMWQTREIVPMNPLFRHFLESFIDYLNGNSRVQKRKSHNPIEL